MPRDEDHPGKLSGGQGFVEGSGPESLTEAVRQAVDAANQPPGTILKVDLYVQSVGDPDVGAYKVIVTPI